MHPIFWVGVCGVAVGWILIEISFAAQAPIAAGAWLAVCYIGRQYVDAAPWSDEASS